MTSVPYPFRFQMAKVERGETPPWSPPTQISYRRRPRPHSPALQATSTWASRFDPPAALPRAEGARSARTAPAEAQDRRRRLEALDKIMRATVCPALLIPPIEEHAALRRDGSPERHLAEEIDMVRSSKAFRAAGTGFVMGARNTRRIGDTEENVSGTFLFNHFTAEDPERALEAWESLTGWYTTKTGVDNSTLLQPIGEAPYAFVNYVRLPRGPVRFMLDRHQAELPHVCADKAARERHGGLAPAVRGRLSGSVIARTVLAVQFWTYTCVNWLRTLRGAFPKGNLCMQIRDVLGTIYDDRGLLREARGAWTSRHTAVEVGLGDGDAVLRGAFG